MKSSLRVLAAAAALAATTLSAQAATTTLTFSELVGVHSSLTYNGTVGGTLTVTSNTGSLTVVLGELGVATWTNWDPRLNAGEAITFTFSQTVSLSGWDMDDGSLLNSKKFKLSVDGGSAQQFSLNSTSSATPLIGTSFTFAYDNQKYFIDSLKFSSVTPVPEASSMAMALAGLGMVGFIASRRRGNRAA